MPPLPDSSRHICMRCLQCFATEILLERHLNTAHLPPASAVMLFSCGVCHVRFSTQYSLQLHQALEVHYPLSQPGSSPARTLPNAVMPDMFPCPQCGHIFNQEANRDRHLATHFIGQQPPTLSQRRVRCEACHGLFINRLAYSRHLPSCDPHNPQR